MLVYERHFSTPVIGGTGHAQCNIWSCLDRYKHIWEPSHKRVALVGGPPRPYRPIMNGPQLGTVSAYVM